MSITIGGNAGTVLGMNRAVYLGSLWFIPTFSTPMLQVPIQTVDIASNGAFSIVLPQVGIWKVQFYIPATSSAPRFYNLTSSVADLSTIAQVAIPQPQAGVVTSAGGRFISGTGVSLLPANFILTGWGTGAIIGSVIGNDQAWSGIITAGTSPSLSPTVTLTFTGGAWPNPPICVSKMNGGTGQVVDLNDAPTATQNVITYNGIPVVNLTYQIFSITMGV